MRENYNDGKSKKVTYDSNIGIYGIFCEETTRVYIGQSKNIPSRLRVHKNALRKYSYTSKARLREMQDDWNKYGENAFIFTQICKCEEERLLEMETYYCKRYHDLGYELYNTFIHTDSTGIHCPEPFVEIIKKIIDLLDKGQISVRQMEEMVDYIENNSFQ